MLFKIDDSHTNLEPCPFTDFAGEAKLEKDLENLLATHLFDVLFEGTPLMPFHQSRRMQEEADVYALDEAGRVVIFEIKRSTASADAASQLLRYAEGASRWGYADISRKWARYAGTKRPGTVLRVAHQEAFGLDAPLPEEAFNGEQRLLVVGSAADDDLVRAVDYWKRRGLPIDFLPYRLYRLGGQRYLEFFAKPHDLHVNPSERKGVLFDTNRRHDEAALGTMFEKRRISSFGDRKDAVRSLGKGDVVFYSHAGCGLVAAARVTGSRVQEGDDELYWSVEFLTPIPKDLDRLPCMPFYEVSRVTGKSFYWARIQKVPYLSHDEADRLLEALRAAIGEG
jgi:hypothetical protein